MQPESFKEDGQRALERFHKWVQAGAGGQQGWQLEAENHEGWRVVVDEGDGGKGWLLLRASLHDPLLVLNAESDIPEGECFVLHEEPAQPVSGPECQGYLLFTLVPVQMLELTFTLWGLIINTEFKGPYSRLHIGASKYGHAAAGTRGSVSTVLKFFKEEAADIPVDLSKLQQAWGKA